MFSVLYFKYWKKDYGVDLPPSTATTTFPTTTGDWQSSKVASNFQALAPQSYDFATKPLLTYEAGATASWAAPSSPTAVPYEVYEWNPQVYSATTYSIENPSQTTLPLAYTITEASGTPTTAPSIDRIADVQGWYPLGAYSFTGGAGQGVSLTTGTAIINPIRVSHVMYRPFTWAYDDFSSGTLTGWTVVGGTWAASTGVVQSNTGATTESILRRSSGSYADGFVRASVLRGTATSVGIIARYTDYNHYYLLRFDPAGNLALLKQTPSGWTNIGVMTGGANINLPSSINLHAPVELVLVTNGTVLRGLVNGREYLNAIDSDYSTGMFGVRCYGGTATFYKVGGGN